MIPLTHAPLPDWGDVASIVTARLATDTELAHPWLRGDARPFWFSRSAWSLYTIAQLRKRVTAKPSIRAWLPGYFCNESLEPLRDLGVHLDFYPVLPDGSANLEACVAMLESGPPDLVVAVHYFGQPAALAGLARLSRESGAWLIEDAAHVLRSTAGIGECGDFVLYSPHKLLPIPDGALLLIRDNGPGSVTRELLSVHDFTGLYDSTVGGRQPPVRATYGWLAKRLLQKMDGCSGRASGPGFHDDDGAANSHAFLPPGMSTLARKLLGAMIDRLDEEEAVRKVNQAEWWSRLKPNGVFPDSMESLPSPETPYLAGVHLPNATVAERVYDLLQQARIPVVSWPDLPPEVLADPARQKVAIAMRETRVFLPVHRSIDAASIQSAIESASR